MKVRRITEYGKMEHLYFYGFVKRAINFDTEPLIQYWALVASDGWLYLTNPETILFDLGQTVQLPEEQNQGDGGATTH